MPKRNEKPGLFLPGLLGNDVWQRARSISFGLLGLGVAMALVAIVFLLQLTWPNSPRQPLPSIPAPKADIGAAVAVGPPRQAATAEGGQGRPGSGGTPPRAATAAGSEARSGPEATPAPSGGGTAVVVSAPPPAPTHDDASSHHKPGPEPAKTAGPPAGNSPPEAPATSVPAPKPVTPPPAAPPPPAPAPVAEVSNVPGNGNANGKGNGNGPPSPPPAVGNPHN